MLGTGNLSSFVPLNNLVAVKIEAELNLAGDLKHGQGQALFFHRADLVCDGPGRKGRIQGWGAKTQDCEHTESHRHQREAQARKTQTRTQCKRQAKGQQCSECDRNRCASAPGQSMLQDEVLDHESGNDRGGSEDGMA